MMKKNKKEQKKLQSKYRNSKYYITICDALNIYHVGYDKNS